MSDETDNLDPESSSDEAGSPVGGERLAEARRELQIPIVDIAKELHLDEYKVRALERNEFDVIGAPVFAKGHLRKFAQLVRVDEADVMADYYMLTRASATQPFIAIRQKQRRTISPGPWIGLIAFLAAIATAYWWFALREKTPEAPTVGAVAPLPVESTPVQQEDTSELPIEDNEVATQVELPEPEPDATPILDTDTNSMTLSISYSGDSWTEITDARGERLFFDLGKSGRTEEVRGEAPFNVLFGDANNVSLAVNGSAFNIPASDRRGRTARLTITGP